MRMLLAALIAVLTAQVTFAADTPVYELRIYTCEPGKLEALDSRFRDHTMRIFEKHGMKNVGYWHPIEGDMAGNTLVYVLEHASRDAAKASWDAFRNDPEWKKVAAESREAHGKILAKSPESVYFATTDYSPVVAAPHADKLAELRIYTTHEGKLDALHARFRDHTDAIFKTHGMQALAYWKPLDAPKSENVMYYILEHADRDASKASWKAFGSDPVWKAAFAESTKDGRLLSERPVAIFMKPTDYSPKQ